MTDGIGDVAEIDIKHEPLLNHESSRSDQVCYFDFFVIAKKYIFAYIILVSGFHLLGYGIAWIWFFIILDTKIPRSYTILQ